MEKNISKKNLTKEKIIGITTLALLLGIAFFLRTWNIEQIPAGLYPDEAMNGVDAIRAIETGEYKIFYPNNNGREGLFINLQALSILLFGANIAALKLWSAIFGTLTVLGVFLLARELWHKQGVALLASFLTAFSYWSINFSRIGFRAIMVPFILSFSLYFFLRGLRTKSFTSFIISGLIFGLGFHTYIAFRVAPLILIFLTIGCILSYREFLKHYWKHALVFIAGLMITTAPIAYEFITHSEYLSSRSASISIFSPDVNHGNLPLTFTKTLGLSLIKYNFVGDMNWRHNYPPYPILDFLTGMLFLIGFVFLVTNTIILLRRRFAHGEKSRELMISIFLLGWFFTMLIPEFLTEEGLPHALRSIGTLPVIFLIASMPFLWFKKFIQKQEPGAKVGTLLLMGSILMIISLWNTGKYFIFFAENPHAHGAFNENYTTMSRFINALPENIHPYVLSNAGGTMIDNGLSITAQPILFLTHEKNGFPVEFLHPDTRIRKPAIILPLEWDDEIAKKVLSTFPNSTSKTIHYGTNPEDTFKILVIE